jgi:RNA polymerase beta subunit
MCLAVKRPASELLHHTCTRCAACRSSAAAAAAAASWQRDPYHPQQHDVCIFTWQHALRLSKHSSAGDALRLQDILWTHAFPFAAHRQAKRQQRQHADQDPREPESHIQRCHYHVQEIVKQNGEIIVQPQKQYRPGEEASEDVTEEKRITFGQVTVSYPTQVGRDGEAESVMPSDARLRNLTYACPLKVDVTVQDITRDADGALVRAARAAARARTRATPDLLARSRAWLIMATARRHVVRGCAAIVVHITKHAVHPRSHQRQTVATALQARSCSRAPKAASRRSSATCRRC